MDSISDAGNNRFKIDLNLALSGRDLMEEASKMPVEEFDTGHGITIQRQGMMIKVVGGENMSPHAMTAAMQSAKMGGDAGRAMFDTYMKNNPEEFDGSRTFDAILQRANERPTPPAPRATARTVDESAFDGTVERGGAGAVMTGTPAGDFLAALYNSELYGGDGNDTLVGGNGSELYGEAGDDTLTGGSKSTLDGGDGDDDLFATSDSTLVGGAGNDRLDGYDRMTMNGGDGDDTLSAYAGSTFTGGAGNDRMSAYDNARFDGGAGDDSMKGYNDAVATDMAGDNYVHVYRRAVINTGDGNDWIGAYDDADIHAGHGNNMITAYSNSSVTSGDDADLIEVGANSRVVSGGGDDVIDAGSASTVYAGKGDDRVTLKGGSVYHFKRGDGNDIVGGGAWGTAYRQTENLSSSIVAFGQGIEPGDLSFQASGNDLIVTVGDGDSLTFRDYQRHGIPSMTFEDGTTLGSTDIAEAVGPGEPYRPASQLMQDWHDANAAARQAAKENETA